MAEHFLRNACICLLLLACGFLTPALLADQPDDGTPVGRVLERFNPAILFHAGYDGGTTDADMAAGDWKPIRTEGTASFVPGLSGQALATGIVTYRGERNAEFRMPGTLLVWLSISRATPPPAQEGYDFPLRMYASDATTPHSMLMLGKSDRANGVGVYVHVEATGKKHGQIHAGSSADWKRNEWHLFAITWRPNTIELSLDGAAPQMAVAPSLPSKPTQFIVAANNDPVSGYQCLVDELMILNRPLAPDEIQWVYRTFRP